MGVYSTAYQGAYLTVFYSGGSKPFLEWDMHVRNGCIKTLMDPQLKILVTDILSTNVTTTFMCCPKGNQTLGIYLPFLVMIVKNLKKYFAFEVTILDSRGWKRRFRVANFQSCTKVSCLSTVMPIGLADGWNQIQFNLCDFTKRAYNTQFAEVVSLKINANIRLKRIYFASRLVPEEELPKEYRLFYPLHRTCESRKPIEHTTDAEREPNITPIFSKENIDQEDIPVFVHEEKNLNAESFTKPTEEEEEKEKGTTRRKSIISSGSKKGPRSSVEIQLPTRNSQELTAKSQDLDKKSQELARKSKELVVKSQESVKQSQERVRKSLDNANVDMNTSQGESAADKRDSRGLFRSDSQNVDLKQVFRISSDASNTYSHNMSTPLTPNSKSSEHTNVLSVPNISRVYKIPNIFTETQGDETNAND